MRVNIINKGNGLRPGGKAKPKVKIERTNGKSKKYRVIYLNR